MWPPGQWGKKCDTHTWSPRARPNNPSGWGPGGWGGEGTGEGDRPESSSSLRILSLVLPQGPLLPGRSPVPREGQGLGLQGQPGHGQGVETSGCPTDSRQSVLLRPLMSHTHVHFVSKMFCSCHRHGACGGWCGKLPLGAALPGVPVTPRLPRSPGGCQTPGSVPGRGGSFAQGCSGREGQGCPVMPTPGRNACLSPRALGSSPPLSQLQLTQLEGGGASP